jgi:hypothetical protein
MAVFRFFNVPLIFPRPASGEAGSTAKSGLAMILAMAMGCVENLRLLWRQRQRV